MISSKNYQIEMFQYLYGKDDLYYLQGERVFEKKVFIFSLSSLSQFSLLGLRRIQTSSSLSELESITRGLLVGLGALVSGPSLGESGSAAICWLHSVFLR